MPGHEFRAAQVSQVGERGSLQYNKSRKGGVAGGRGGSPAKFQNNLTNEKKYSGGRRVRIYRPVRKHSGEEACLKNWGEWLVENFTKKGGKKMEKWENYRQIVANGDKMTKAKLGL